MPRPNSSACLLTLAALLSALASPAFAVQENRSGPLTPVAATTAAKVEPVDATVRKIDKSAGKITLAHGPLTNLGMPAMTMTFKAKDVAVLALLKEGDKVRFVAEMAGSDYLATRVEKLK